jgi:serine/threonine protein kinase
MTISINRFQHPSIKYEFIKKLGDGSASKIYISRNKETNEEVIVKCINKNEEWRSELAILKSIKNKRLLGFLDFYETFRHVYIVTEYYKGKDLFEHIDINVPYPVDYAKLLITEMANCVKECHKLDIAHLDVKCENFMVVKMTPKPELVLIDFGHAEKTEENIIKDSYSRYGTTFYLCPEGYGKVFSTKSDIWSLGVCAHLLLTGEYPFNCDSSKYYKRGELMVDENLPNDAKNFVYACLEFDPVNRYTIDELLGSEFLSE